MLSKLSNSFTNFSFFFFWPEQTRLSSFPLSFLKLFFSFYFIYINIYFTEFFFCARVVVLNIKADASSSCVCLHILGRHGVGTCSTFTSTWILRLNFGVWANNFILFVKLCFIFVSLFLCVCGCVCVYMWDIRLGCLLVLLLVYTLHSTYNFYLSLLSHSPHNTSSILPLVNVRIRCDTERETLCVYATCVCR